MLLISVTLIIGPMLDCMIIRREHYASLSALKYKTEVLEISLTPFKLQNQFNAQNRHIVVDYFSKTRRTQSYISSNKVFTTGLL